MSEVNYSTALRCIGQDLQRRRISIFTLKREGSHFVVCPEAPSAGSLLPGVLRYTPSDLEIMERCGESQRGVRKAEHFLHCAQMLRVIGEHLDKYGSTLLSISCNQRAPADPPFRVEYVTREGEHVIDDRPGTAIFDQCVLMFQKRRRSTNGADARRP
jgi:hypothetical protein